MTFSSLLRDLRLPEGGLSAVPESTQPAFSTQSLRRQISAERLLQAEGIAGAAALCIRVPGSRRMSHQCPRLDFVVLTTMEHSSRQFQTLRCPQYSNLDCPPPPSTPHIPVVKVPAPYRMLKGAVYGPRTKRHGGRVCLKKVEQRNNRVIP